MTILLLAVNRAGWKDINNISRLCSCWY